MKIFDQYKIIIWFLFVTLCLSLWHPIYSLLLLGYKDPKIIYLNATSNRFDSNIFFDTKEVEDTHFLEDIIEKMDGLDKILQECEAESSNQKLWQYMDLHQNELINIAMSNDDYILYLNQKDLTLEDLIKFTNHMAHLSEYVILADFYIIFFIISFFTLWICNYRRGFYIVGFFIYLISSISFFSNGMSDYLLSAVFSTLTAPLKIEFTYEDAFIFRQYFLNTFKEALLTFVLIDTAREIYKDNRNSYFQKTIRYTFRSLEIQIAHLEKNADLKNEFIGRLIIPSQQLEKKCRKTDNRLSQLLYSLRTNTEKHPCSKYIDEMKEAVDLMIKNDYSSV